MLCEREEAQRLHALRTPGVEKHHNWLLTTLFCVGKHAPADRPPNPLPPTHHRHCGQRGAPGAISAPRVVHVAPRRCVRVRTGVGACISVPILPARLVHETGMVLLLTVLNE